MRRARALATALMIGLVLAACGAGAPNACHARPQPSAGGDLTRRLIGLLEQGPCAPQAGYAYGARDNRGAPLDVLDPIADPAGGYLGVYHVRVHRPGPAATYQVLLAHSHDLITWTRLRVLVPAGASMPTLRGVPGGSGFLLAYEKRAATANTHLIRVQWYRSRTALLAGHPAMGVDLPRRYSRFNNGTPSFWAIRWHGSPARSALELAFHYEDARGAGPGADREAVGVLIGFRRWITHRDTRIDGLIDQTGLTGSHGDQRQFEWAGRPWRVYEANPAVFAFGDWHTVLDDVAANRVHPLTIETPLGRFSTSFGNPTAAILPAPSGHGRVLVMTLFVFSSGQAAREAGELVFYRPL